MKISLTAILAFSASASALSIFNGNAAQSPIATTGLEIPGESPLKHCNENYHDDLLVVEFVNLDPNPPQAGQTLRISAVGTFLEDIYEESYVLIQVKYGLIKLLSTKADLCEQIQNVDMQCPIEKGKQTITKDVEMPKQIPPGKYTVTADVFTNDHRPIICLTAEVVFQ